MSLTRFCGIRTASFYDEPARRALPRTSTDSRPLGMLRELASTVPVKTHDLGSADDPTAAVYLIRDGRDAVVSYTHFLRRAEEAPEAQALEETMGQVVEGTLGFGSWSRHIEKWTTRMAPTYLVRFEDLLADPVTVVRDAAGALTLPLPPINGVAKPPDFEEERRKRPLLVRRGITGSWRSEMPAAIEERFWELHGETMLAMGYKR